MKSYLFVLFLFCVSILAGMSGTYTIGGSGADYATLSAALTDVNTQGLSGYTTLILRSGNYDGAFVLNIADNSHTLVISAQQGADVWLYNSSANSTENYVLKINNTSNVYLQHLRFSTSGSFSRAIWLHGNSDNVGIANNQFHNSGSSSGEAVYVTADGSSDPDNLNISLCAFYNGYAHIYTNISNSLTNLANWTFYLNYHSNAYYGMYIRQATGLNINALITQDLNAGIMLDQCSGAVEINSNRISAFQTGISVNSCSFDGSGMGIVNNIVKVSGQYWYNPNSFSDSQGINILSYGGLNVYHNSVQNTSPTTGSYCISIAGSGNAVRKNMLVSSGNGYVVNMWNSATNAVEYNNMWSGHTNISRMGNDYQRSISEFNDLTSSVNLSYYPYFSDDFLRTEAPMLDNWGPSYGVPIDFNGATRSSTSPDIGAHEYTSDPSLTRLSGVVNVGTGQTYTTLQSFFDAAGFRGILGVVTANLTDTLYVENPTVYGFPGSSYDNYVQIIPSDPSGATIRWDDQSAVDNYVMMIRRSSYITMRRIRFYTASSQYSNLVWMPGYNNTVRFINCDFYAPVNGMGSSIVSDYQDANSNLDVLACNFHNNRYGISHSGNWLTVGSTWFGGQYMGVNLTTSNGCSIAGNGFYDNTYAAVSTNGAKQLLVYRNTIKGSGHGLLLYNLGSDGEDRNLVYNNRIHITGGNQGGGITLAGTGIKVLNNSVLNENSNSAACYMYQSPTQTEIVNNIFQASNGLAFEITHFTAQAGNVTNYNSYYSLGTYLARLGSVYCASIDEMRAYEADNNAHSVNIDPHFTADLHTQSPWLRGAGMPRSEFDVDVDLEPRGSAWDIGADQQTGAYTLSPLSGTYSVGPGGAYSTLQSFLDALHLHGSNGDVTANLLPGIYSGYNVLRSYHRVIPGSKVTFNALSGASFNLIPEGTYATDNFIFRLDGADNVSFTNITFNVAASNRQSHLIYLLGKCDDITVQNCTFNMGTQSSTAIMGLNSINVGLWISHCNFAGGSYALQLSGVSTGSRYNGIRVQYCVLTGTYQPFAISYAGDLKLLNNSFDDFKASPSLNYLYGNSDIYFNKFRAHNFVGSYSSMALLTLNSLNGTAEQRIEIIANILYTSANQVQSVTGMSIANSSFLRLLHNSIAVENYYPFEYGTALSLSNCTDVWSSNNIFSNTGSGYAVQISQSSGLTFNNNAYYNTFKQLGKIDNTDYSATSFINTQLQDGFGIFANPLIDANGYAQCAYLGGKGALSFVELDVDQNVYGSPRDIGANVITDAAPLGTSISVGAGADFNTLDSALDALMSRGIAANTQVYLQPGAHYLNKQIGYIPNTLQHTLTITGADNAWLYGSAQSTASNYVIGLKAVRNVILNGLKISPQTQDYSRGITFSRYIENVSVQNCHFAISANTLNTDASAAVYGYDAILQDVSIVSNVMDNFSRGISLSGSTAYPDIAGGLSITANTVNSAHTGIALYSVSNPQVIANRITDWRNTGINMNSCRGAAELSRNKVNGSGYYALNIGHHVPGTDRVSISNNFLRYASNNWGYAMLVDNTPNMDICFNTMVAASPNSGAYAYAQANNCADMNFVNNIVQASGTYAAVFNNLAYLTRRDHNLFFSNTGAAVNLGGANISNLAAWTSSTGDSSSIFANPLLQNDGFELTATSPARYAGIMMTGIDIDIQGSYRNNPPSIGCRESNISSLDTPQNIAMSINAATSSITLSWDAVDGAGMYRIYTALDPLAVDWDMVPDALTGQTQITISLLPGTHRFYRVQAFGPQ